MASSTTKSPPPTTDALPPSPKRFARLRPHAKPRPLDCLFAPPTLDVDARRPRLLHPSTFLLLQKLGVTSRPARFALSSRHGDTSVAAGIADDALPTPPHAHSAASGSAGRGTPAAPRREVPPLRPKRHRSPRARYRARPVMLSGCPRVRGIYSLPSAHRARLRTPRAADVADPDPDSTVAAHGGDDRRPSTRASRHRRHFAAPTYAPRRPFPTSQRAPPATPRFGVHARLLVVMWRPQVPRNARKSATAQAPRSSTIPAHLAARCEFAARKVRIPVPIPGG
ncbi:hypothetical protein B0H15DRAFT_1028138, partial [Mycena belliarum]